MTQAISLRKKLINEGHEVVGAMVGKSPARILPSFFQNKIGVPVYTFESPNFLPAAKNKKVSLTQSIIYNLFRCHKYLLSIRMIRRIIDETQADVVVNFYELLTGFTYLFYHPHAKMLCVAHQYLFLHPDFVFPDVNPVSLASLRLFTRLTAIGSTKKLALSFRKMREVSEESLVVIPPLLRDEVIEAKPVRGNYMHGYLLNSGLSEEICNWHKSNPNVKLHFFWDKKEAGPLMKVNDYLYFHNLDDEKFIKYMAGSKAYVTTAGFESVCEAMYLGKPIMMIPTHIEQECNANDAVRSGAGITSDNFNLDKLLDISNGHKTDRKSVV